MSGYISKHCDLCKNGQNTIRDAAKYCVECEESYCESCSTAHRTQKATKRHDLTNIEDFVENPEQSPSSDICEPCSENKITNPAVSRCRECEESYCENCTRIHKSQKATRNHEIFDLQEENKRSVCEACEYYGIQDRPASALCITCDEMLCVDCTRAHKSQKATRKHRMKEKKEDIVEQPMSETANITSSNTNCCDRCTDEKIITELGEAFWFCFTCKQVLCERCTNRHKQEPDASLHRIVFSTQQRNESEEQTKLPNDKKSMNEETEGTNKHSGSDGCYMHKVEDIAGFCLECKVQLCLSCVKEHGQSQETQTHRLLYNGSKEQTYSVSNEHPTEESTPLKSIIEEPDGSDNYRGSDGCYMHEDEDIAGFCVECKNQLCLSCVEEHKQSQQTKHHRLLYNGAKEQNHSINKDQPTEEPNSMKCTNEETENTNKRGGSDGCYMHEDEDIAGFCLECKHQLCLSCVEEHRYSQDTKHHRLLNNGSNEQKDSINNDQPTEELTIESISRSPDSAPESTLLTDLCQVCQKQGIVAPVTAFCFDCLRTLCESCTTEHSEDQTTKIHQIMSRVAKNKSSDDEKAKTKDETNQQPDENEKDVTRNQPGKPMQTGALKVNSITITWKPPQEYIESYCYQIRYKENINGAKWQYYDEEKTQNTTLVLRNLKSHSSFVNQVRMVNNETEGPYSEVSDPIETLPSAAELVFNQSHEVSDLGSQLKLRKFRLNENLSARNPELKTRKLTLGDENAHHFKEKFVLLLGASGTGKTTFVNGLINYLFGVTFGDCFRFSINDTEPDGQATGTYFTKVPQKTQWVTCYSISPVKGSQIDYKLTLIDTPGFGDSGIEKDAEIKQQLKELFSAVDEKGVLFVDAVCIFMRASESRLTVTQEYIYTTITSLFHKDIKENICSIVTFSDGKDPPVLSALKQANLPYEIYFPFNTTEVFSDNLQTSQTSLTKVFFEMNISSFDKFMKKLSLLESKSLSQSKEVMQKRQQIEDTAEILLSKVGVGLNKMEDCRSELEVLEKFKAQMIDNKDFKYKRSKHVQNLIPLEKGLHTTNCLHCNVTCHDNCAFANDEDKARCVAMDSNGYCKRCEDHCFWKEHKNTPFIIEWKLEEEECTYEEMMQKYQQASNEVVTHEAIATKMKKELDEIEEDMLDLMRKIADCSEQLSKIALRANPLSVAEHIDIIIENEKWERKPGFQGRINNLEKLKRRVAVGEEFEQFQKDKENMYK